jgi:hypothetical protein
MTVKGNQLPDRPEFMVTLGLLPPYTVEDVRRAYHAKARTAHPDAGGSAEEFIRLEQAFERALEYAKFHSGRIRWLSAQVERYARQDKVIAEVRRRGGEVEIEPIDWMKRTIGEDWAQVMDRLVGIRLRGHAGGDEVLKYLGEQAHALEFLRGLDVSGSHISDQGLSHLWPLQSLRRLDLSDTPITRHGLQVLRGLRQLRWLNLAGTAVGCWGRWRLRRTFPKLQVVAVPHQEAESGQHNR